MIESGISVPSEAGTFTSSATTFEKSTGDGASSLVSTSALAFASYEYQSGDDVHDVSCAKKPGRSASVTSPAIEPFTGSGTSRVTPS